MIRRMILSVLCLSICLAPATVTAAEPTKLIPADAEQVAFINIKQLLGSKLVQKYALKQIKDALENNKESKQLFQAINMDPMKDVHSVFLTNSGSTGKQVLVVLSGKFDTKKIQETAGFLAKMKPDEMKISTVKGTKVYEIIKNSSSTWAALLDDSTLVVSPVKKYITGCVSGDFGKTDKQLAKAIAGVDQKGSAWVAGLITDQAKDLLKANPQTAQMAEALKAFTGGFTISSDLAARVNVHTTDAQTAKVLAQLGNQMKGVLTFVLATNEELRFLAKDLKTLKIGSDSEKVGISLNISESSLKSLIELAENAQ